MTTLTKLTSIWVGEHHWFIAGVSPNPDQKFPDIHDGQWRTPPTWRSPAALVEWAVQVARGVDTATYASTGVRIGVRRKADSDGVLRFALIISPEAGALFGAAQPDAGLPHPWAAGLRESGWRVRTPTPKPPKRAGVWLTIERPAQAPEIEIGILMAGWCDPANRTELATHGLVRADNDRVNRVDPWGSLHVQGEYRRLTGWPLSAGAGMAAIKGLQRSARVTQIRWAPSWDQWNATAVMALGRPTARPWHVYWVTPNSADVPRTGTVAMWDANADYLVAWTAARFARGELEHTGPSPLRGANGRWRAGWYLVGELQFAPAVRHLVDQLPPVWGSRTPNSDGQVWVTHPILDLLDSLQAAYQISGSYTCDDSGQVARPWGERLKAALMEAKREHAQRPDSCTAALLSALKQSYARGYPLLETSGIIRRPDWVDTLIDQRWLSGYLRIWNAARTTGRRPLVVSADEITYQWRDGDDDHGPLGEPSPIAYGAYKLKATGPAEDWHQSLQDGRHGRWWLPAPAELPPPPTVPHQAPQTPPAPATGSDWYSQLTGD